MIKKILISVLAFLLTIFPNNSTLLENYQELQFIGVKSVNEIIVKAVKEKNADLIYELYCPYYKENVEDLHRKLNELFDCIDGEILEVSGGGRGIESSKNNGKYSYHKRNWNINFKTDTYDEATAVGTHGNINYTLYVSWTISDTRNPEFVGLEALTLYDETVFPSKLIYKIVADEFWIGD